MLHGWATRVEEVAREVTELPRDVPALFEIARRHEIAFVGAG